MVRMKFAPVGAKINYKSFDLIVTQTEYNQPTCAGCFFTEASMNNNGLKAISCYKHGYACTAAGRKDKKQVVFKKI